MKLKKQTIQSKILAAVILIELTVSFLLGGISIVSSKNMLLEDANDTLKLTSMKEADKINSTIQQIEQSVDTLSAITLDSIADFNQFKTSEEYEKKCTSQLSVPTINSTLHTTGAISSYVRYNPEFTNPTSGLFITKAGSSFEFLTPTDFSMYDPSDSAHVGWYYIPVQAAKPIWMDPYQNANTGQYLISYVVPIFKDSVSVGIVGMDIDFNTIIEQVSNAKVYDSGYAYLVNSQNQIMYHKNYETGTDLNEVNKDVAKLLQNDDKEGVVTHLGKETVVYCNLDNGMKYVMTVPYKEIIQSGRRLSSLIFIVTIICLILAIGYGLFISRKISNPIKKLTTIISNTADFNFTHTEGGEKLTKIKDETGDMARGISLMREKLRGVVGDIEHSCTQLSDNITLLQESSDKVNEMAENNASLTEELAAGMEETNATTENMRETIGSVSENASKIKDLSNEGKNLSKEIMERAIQLEESTEVSSKKTKDIYSKVKEEARLALEKSKAVEKINTLTDAIAEISEQTGLLALNASIEAARAGEAGRGFAVVASEISTLANQTAQTVSDINAIVHEVHEAVTNMSKCLDTSMEFVGKQVLKDYEDFSKVGEQYKEDATVIEGSMNHINQAILTLSEKISQINHAIADIGTTMNEASIGVNDIAEKTSDMGVITNQNTSAVEDSKQEIDVLKNIVEQFTLN